jgi:CHAT domain-containing protein
VRRQTTILLVFVLLVSSALADELQRARAALDRGRPDLALPFTEGSSVASRVTKLEALCELNQYTQARQLLGELESEDHGGFSSPYDFRFYLFRGNVELAGHNFELAEKNYSEALRRAQTADQRVQVYMRRAGLFLEQEDLERARETFSETKELSAKISEPSLAAELLEVNARMQYERGEVAGAMVCNRVARELYLSMSMTSRAAHALYRSELYIAGNLEDFRALGIVEKALAEFLSAEDYPSAVSLLNGLQYLSYALSGEQKRIEDNFRDSAQKIPVGLHRQRALLAWANYQLGSGQETEGTFKMLQDLAMSSDREMRCLAHIGIASYHGAKGEREESLSQLRLALELASPQMKLDPQWRVSPGNILLRMSYQEKARRNYEESIRLAHQGIEAEPAADWAYWRVEARYDTLMATIESYDLKAAEVELSASLKEIDRLPKISQRVGALTTILAALLLNRSVEADVLDPALLLLGEYPDTTRELLVDSFEAAGGTDRYLVQFDQWHQQLIEKDDSTQPFPQLYKGLFLEALGRTREAEGALRSALEIAERKDVRSGKMLARVLLARIALAQDNRAEAVEHLTIAASVAETLNPLAARFYLLVAGSAQRQVGQFETALATYEKAIAAIPRRGWPGFYGRALTYEQMGRYQDALDATDLALQQVSETERTHTVAELRALRARLLTKLGKPEDAVPLYSLAHKGLLYSAALPRVTSEYADLLISAERSGEALQLFVETLDHISSLNMPLSTEQRELFERTVTLALELGRNDTALKYLQLSRSAELLDSVNLSDVSTEDEETRNLLAQIEKLKYRLVSLREESGQVKDRSTRESIGQQIADTRGEFFTKLNELRVREPDFEALVQVSGSELAAIQELLPKGTALMEFFPGRATLYVFLVTSDSFSLHQVSLSRQELTRMTERLLTMSTDPNSSPDQIQELSRSLYDSLVGVADRKLKGVTSLQLVPSGPLWELPFAVLTAPDGRALCDQYEISYLGSSELLKILSRRRNERSALSPALLVRGAADLKGARSEIEGLAELLGEALVLTPDNLDKSVFRQAVKGRRLLHFASHSVVSREAGASYLQLGDDRLSLEDIYGLELEPSSMVVLSSCRSGVGVAVPGKEVTSLATAFSVAGASSVIASRWPVDDRSTARFFELFYSEMLKGESRGQALRETQRQMAMEKPHPYYWAAFSLLGDPR